MNNFSGIEKDILKVLRNGIDEVENVEPIKPTLDRIESSISSSEVLLKALGYSDDLKNIALCTQKEVQRILVIRTFDELLLEANRKFPNEIQLSEIFTDSELSIQNNYINQLYSEFDAIHKLDIIDILIPTIAGILSGAVDCALGGFIKSSDGRNIPGSMSDYISSQFNKYLPKEKIKYLETIAKVPYDALNYDNKGNVIVEHIVEGLSPVFHHLVSLGHDPILGFLYGVLDLMRGSNTTIDFNGKFVVQFIDGFSDKKAQNLFESITKVFLHMISDVNGSSNAKNDGMGLPVPFMALFNGVEFGKVGSNDSISELVKSMYYQGYDFRHFCSMSIPVMISEVIVRVSYFVKRLSEGYSLSDSLPITLNHIHKPKLGTMLFIAHSSSVAINTGKVIFTKEPLNINYAQWLAFARYTVKQIKWVLHDKPNYRHRFVMGVLNEQWDTIYGNLNEFWIEYSDKSTVVIV